MAQGRRPARRSIQWNHPSHPHPIVESDVLAIYSAYGGKWRCDVCGRVFDGNRAPSSGDTDHRNSYHCPKCNFDVCSSCFKGHLHTFHRHRLKKARTTVVYRHYDGLWHCDACRSVHGEHTEQLCYHCDRCEVDLCSTCFLGKWEHVLHTSMPGKQDHTLRPIDPRIEYITYLEWRCDNCNRVFSCQSDNGTAFHCDECSFDLCKTCFAGEKHPFHPHPLVAIERTFRSSSSSEMLECSNCERSIQTTNHYQCRQHSCQYRLCQSCFSRQPELHPYHDHALHVCDPLAVYPQSGGMWHCDRCTANSPNHQPTPLPHTETMYHCETCEYDLCFSCYSEGRTSRFKPVQVTEQLSFTPSTPETSDFSYNSGGYGTYQPYTQATYYTSQDYHTRLSRPLVTGFQSFLPLPSQASMSRRPCLICNVREATVTFLHRGIPHSGRALCCDSCAFDVVSNRRPCPACRIPPDEVFRVP